MIARAIARFVRVSPRKTRLVLDIIRGKSVENAFAILANTNKVATFYITQALKSALDSAVKNTKGASDASNLYISKVTADAGPMLKRWRAASMGRATPIRRRTAHILIELDMVRASDNQNIRKSVKSAVRKKETKTKVAAIKR